MSKAEDLIAASFEEQKVMSRSVINDELVIDGETREINVPESEMLFGVEGDVNIERKHFRCPKIVGDNIDLSKHLIYVAYVYTENQNNSFLPEIGIQSYLCTDVQTEGDDITFSWKLSGNVFKNPGFIAFKVFAKEKEESPLTVFNTAPAFGIVKMTIPDGNKEIAEEYPDVINQIFDRLDALESGGGGGSGTPGKDGREIQIQNNGTAIQWRYVGDESWTDLVQLSDITGAKGDPGEDGITPTIRENGNWYLGEEDTGKPSRGEKGNPGDKGNPGPTGATPNIQIGTVQTLDPGQQATASMTGTAENPLLNLGIPKGEKGDPGESSEGNPYTLPIMSSTQLGGGKAIEKTDEDVPVAVDPLTGQLFVPTYPESGSGASGITVSYDAEQQAIVFTNSSGRGN